MLCKKKALTLSGHDAIISAIIEVFFFKLKIHKILKKSDWRKKGGNENDVNQAPQDFKRAVRKCK